MDNDLNRRSFLKNCALVGGVSVLSGCSPGQEMSPVALAIHERTLLSKLKKKLGNLGFSRDVISHIVSSIRQRKKPLLDLYAEWDSTLKGGWFDLCCLILACHQELLENGLGSDRAFSCIDQAFFDSSQWAVKSILYLLFYPGDNPEEITTKVGNFIVPLMSGGIQTEQEVRATLSAQNVTRCHFHEFFSFVGEPKLTQILCRYDQIWMAEISKITGYPYRRPETQSLGGKLCRFQFQLDKNLAPFDIIDTGPS